MQKLIKHGHFDTHLRLNGGVKPSLLQKILSNHSDIEILFTKPTKIMRVTLLPKIDPMTFLLTKLISS